MGILEWDMCGPGPFDTMIFDMDHTLVRYKLEPLFLLIYDSLRAFLVNDRCLLPRTPQ